MMWGTPAKVKGTLRFCQTPKPQRPIAQEPCNSSGHGLTTRPAPPSAVPARLHPAFRFIDAAQPGHLIMSCCQGLQPTTPHHPCLQELQPALDSSQQRHPSASKNSSLYKIQASSPLARTFTSHMFQQHRNALSAGWPELYPALRVMDSPQPQTPRKQHYDA